MPPANPRDILSRSRAPNAPRPACAHAGSAPAPRTRDYTWGAKSCSSGIAGSADAPAPAALTTPEQVSADHGEFPQPRSPESSLWRPLLLTLPIRSGGRAVPLPRPRPPPPPRCPHLSPLSPQGPVTRPEALTARRRLSSGLSGEA